MNEETFKNSISEFDCSYQKFSNNHMPIYKEYYVESRDDAEFYSYYLARIHHLPQLMKCYGCDGKEGVLRQYKKYAGQKAGFIVDLDYLPFDASKFEKLIVTTGYSMENFFFYEKGDKYNFEKVFKFYYKNPYYCKKKIAEYLKELKSFIEKYLCYYAFFKTCMEFSNNYIHMNNHTIIKDLDDLNSGELSSLIEEEIKSLNTQTRSTFRAKYEDNCKIIKDSGYMLIRGHDIFDHLVGFLKKEKPYVKESKIRELAYEMSMPDEFNTQFFENVDNT